MTLCWFLQTCRSLLMQCDSCCPNLSWWTNQTYELAWLIVPWPLLALALLSFTASFTAFFSTLFTASFTASFNAYQPYCLNTSCHLALAYALQSHLPHALQSQYLMPFGLISLVPYCFVLCHFALPHAWWSLHPMPLCLTGLEEKTLQLANWIVDHPEFL